MKRFYKNLFAVAAVVAVFVACAKETENPSNGNSKDGFIMSVKAGGAGTKTVIDDNNGGDSYGINWESTDQLGVYEVANGTVQEKAVSTATTPADGGQTASFTFSLEGSPSGPYKYAFVNPSSALDITNINSQDEYTLQLNQNQTFLENSFDPAADVLISKLVESEDRPGTVTANFARVGATARMVLNCPSTSELIQTITFSTTEGNLSGYYILNPATGKLDGNGIVEGENSVILTPDTNTNYDGEVKVWFRLASITIFDSFTVSVRTTNHIYTKVVTLSGDNTLDFEEGKLTKFSVNMTSGVSTLPTGDCLVLAKDGDNYYALKAEKEDGKERLLSVPYTGSLASYHGDADLIWTLSEYNGSFIFENSSKFLGYKGNSNESYWLEYSASEWTESNYLLNITPQETAGQYDVTVNSVPDRYLSKNNSGAFFAFYSGKGQKADIVFVPATVDHRTVVALHFEDDDNNETSVVNLTTDNYDSFFGLYLVADPDESAITDNIEWSYEDNDGVIDELVDGILTLTGNMGTATVTATFAGDETTYRPATASYTIYVDSAIAVGWIETALADITSSDVFVMVGNEAYALSSAGGSSTNPPAVAVTINSGKLVGEIADEIKWTLSGNATDGYTFYPYEKTTKLFCNTDASSSSNTNLRVGDGGNYDRYVFAFTDGDQLVTKDGYTTARYIGINGSSDFRGYTTAGTNKATFKFYKYQDPRPEPNMSWSTGSATATYNTGNDLSFTAPTLDQGDATSVSYSSSDETIATISAVGVVSVNLTDNVVKVGTTTISATCNDGNHKDQTVSYTLTVVDSRDAVATPGFSTPEGEVEAGTVVSFTCETSDVTYYYTVNSTTPTTASTQGSSVTIDADKTVKVIATKTGYKNSEVATAEYTIPGSGSGGGDTKTSTLTFTAACEGSGTADDYVGWTVTSDGTESSYDNNKGIHYGTGSAAVKYISLSTSGISGTITKVVVNASTASGVSATVGVAVGGDAFGGDPKSLSASAVDYTFTGSASGEIIVTVTKPSSATKALYVKSIAVTYTETD